MSHEFRSRRQFLKSSLLGGLGVAAGLRLCRRARAATFSPAEAVNAPIGTPFGIKPGRVAWAFDPRATSWDGVTNAPGWWDDNNTHPAYVSVMLSKVLRSVADSPTDKQSWIKIFTDFNKRHGRGTVGYKAGEKVAVKLNLNQCRTFADSSEANSSYIAPQLVQALLGQLINEAGVAAADITCYDAIRAVPSTIFDRCHQAYPNVHFADSIGTTGRELARPDTTKPLYLSKGTVTLNYPTCLTAATYLINVAGLKGHTLASMTVCAKNHLGSTFTTAGAAGASSMHASIIIKGTGAQSMGAHNGLVDLNGHPQTGGKTLLYMVDAFYATHDNEYKLTTACKWQSAPFNNNWTSSLLASQDGVAIDSVALDFLRNEPTISATVTGAVDNYLHEMAQANSPPSGTFYDPAKTGTRLASLGVHEHWNNATAKKYSRNLGTGLGIELAAVMTDPAPSTIRRGVMP